MKSVPAGLILVVLAGLSSAGCEDVGSEGSSSEPCVDRITELDADEPAGGYQHTAAGVLAQVRGSYSDTIGWVGMQTTSPVTLTLDEEVLAARFVDSDANPDYAEHEIQNCYDRLEFDASISFVTEDGAFDENWVATFEADAPSADIASFRVEFTVADVDGTYGGGGAPPEQTQLFRGTLLPNAVAPQPRSVGSIMSPTLGEIAYWPRAPVGEDE